MLQICDAVYHFHKLGIIHRDLKLFNILANREGHGLWDCTHL